MSANILENPGKMHTLTDDLESFLHVLGWMTLRYVPAIDGYSAVERGWDMAMFNEYLDEGYWKRGGNSKALALGSMSYPSQTFRPRTKTPLLQLIRSLSEPFESLYSRRLPSDSDSDDDRDDVLASMNRCRYDRNMQRLHHPSWFIQRMETALNKKVWPTDDKADETLPIGRLWYETEIQVRTRSSQLQDNHNTWVMSKGVPRSLKREASPTSESSSKRRRCAPAASELHIS